MKPILSTIAALSVAAWSAQPAVAKDNKHRGNDNQRAANAPAQVVHGGRAQARASAEKFSSNRPLRISRPSAVASSHRPSSRGSVAARVQRQTIPVQPRVAQPSRSVTRYGGTDRRGQTFRGTSHHGDNDGHRGWTHYRYYRAPSDAFRHWDRNRIYSWNNHRYHWYDGAWVIVDPGYEYYDSYTVPAVIGSNMVAEVQQELQDEGYGVGVVDGVMGPQTRDAIARYQADHGLYVTARIDDALLNSLNLE